MKKLVKGIIALCLTLCCCFSAISCAEYEGNSKIQRVTITLNVNGESQDFNFKLYLNYAPGTIEHFTYLAEQGYYNNSAISKLNGHVEFGSYYYASEASSLLKSKYDADAVKSYASLITDSYKKDKYVGPGKDARYDEEGFVTGEFLANGFEGNTLGLNGALILKRDILDEENERSPELYNTAKATMGIAFTGDGYFTSNKEFAIIGMICTDDGNDDVDSSSVRLKELMSEYGEDEDGNVYYHYTYDSGERTDKNEDGSYIYGEYFMYSSEHSAYFAQDENGEFTIELERNTNDTKAPVNVLLDEFATYDEFFNVLPYGNIQIYVEKITFKKK